MVNILISGALGKMGRKVYAALQGSGAVAVCGVDSAVGKTDFPLYTSFKSVNEKVDVIIDFSSADNLKNVLEFAEERGCGAVLCATGYKASDLELIEEYSKTIPLFRSANMSFGVNVFVNLIKRAAAALYDFDAEILEMHHNQKTDAPSGTALMMAESVKEVLPSRYLVYGRNGFTGKRDKNEIGIHSLRGGTVVGEHEIVFAGKNERITISHTAEDRSVFAEGAVKAALYISDKKNGLFDMEDLINGK